MSIVRAHAGQGSVAAGPPPSGGAPTLLGYFEQANTGSSGDQSFRFTPANGSYIWFHFIQGGDVPLSLYDNQGGTWVIETGPPLPNGNGNFSSRMSKRIEPSNGTEILVTLDGSSSSWYTGTPFWFLESNIFVAASDGDYVSGTGEPNPQHHADTPGVTTTAESFVSLAICGSANRDYVSMTGYVRTMTVSAGGDRQRRWAMHHREDLPAVSGERFEITAGSTGSIYDRSSAVCLQIP